MQPGRLLYFGHYGKNLNITGWRCKILFVQPGVVLSRGIWGNVTVVSMNSKMYNSAHNFWFLYIACVKKYGVVFWGAPDVFTNRSSHNNDVGWCGFNRLPVYGTWLWFYISNTICGWFRRLILKRFARILYDRKLSGLLNISAAMLCI